jgi:hypothetical protein
VRLGTWGADWRAAEFDWSIWGNRGCGIRNDEQSSATFLVSAIMGPSIGLVSMKELNSPRDN